MTKTKRNYKAVFILDNRGKEDSIDHLIEGVKKEIAVVEGEVTAVENLGKKDFVRHTDSRFTGAIYVNMHFAAPAGAPRALHERLRLNTSVYRALVENA